MNKLSLMQWPGSRGRAKAGVVGVIFPAEAYPALDLHVLESLFMNKLWAPIDRRKAYPALGLISPKLLFMNKRFLIRRGGRPRWGRRRLVGFSGGNSCSCIRRPLVGMRLKMFKRRPDAHLTLKGQKHSLAARSQEIPPDQFLR